MKYRVVRMDPESHRFEETTTPDVEAWASVRGIKVVGYTSDRRNARIAKRPEMVGQPQFDKLLGPMWGGEEDGQPIVRYEDQAAYDALSA